MLSFIAQSVLLLQIVSTSVFAFTVPHGACDVNVDAYTGGWFEIASSWNVANTIERGCECPVAYYSSNATNHDNLDVTNSCIRYGQFWKLQGNAFPVYEDGEKINGNLNVQFSGGRTVPAPKGNYVILKTWTDEFGDYTNAVVGSNNNMNWWYLGRSPVNNETLLENALHTLQSYEYNVTDYRLAVQDCIFTGGHDGVNLVKST